jgi:hypothetical protein
MVGSMPAKPLFASGLINAGALASCLYDGRFV